MFARNSAETIQKVTPLTMKQTPEKAQKFNVCTHLTLILTFNNPSTEALISLEYLDIRFNSTNRVITLLFLYNINLFLIIQICAVIISLWGGGGVYFQ